MSKPFNCPICGLQNANFTVLMDSRTRRLVYPCGVGCHDIYVAQRSIELLTQANPGPGTR